MKIQAFIILSFLFLAAHSLKAQSPVVFKYKYDPSYSVHNYKHPNKAALASKYKPNPIITLDYIKATPAVELAQRNYKTQGGPMQKQLSGAVIPLTTHKEGTNSNHSPAYYKHPFRR